MRVQFPPRPLARRSRGPAATTPGRRPGNDGSIPSGFTCWSVGVSAARRRGKAEGPVQFRDGPLEKQWACMSLAAIDPCKIGAMGSTPIRSTGTIRTAGPLGRRRLRKPASNPWKPGRFDSAAVHCESDVIELWARRPRGRRQSDRLAPSLAIRRVRFPAGPLKKMEGRRIRLAAPLC